MAGRPKLAAFTRWVAEVAKDRGEDWIFDEIAGGKTVTKLGNEINEILGFGSRFMIYAWVKQGGPEREAAYKEAIRLSAEALVDKGREAHESLAEQIDPSPATVSAVKNRGDWYKWEASKRDKENFGDGPSVGQAITDLGQIFLSALQSHGGHVDSLPAGDEQMATPRMQRKLEAAKAAAEEGETLTPEELEVVADGGEVEDEVSTLSVANPDEVVVDESEVEDADEALRDLL